MPVIAVVGNKGGAGKTTLSVNLAVGLAKQTRSVLVDADPQGSASQWRAISGDDTVPVHTAIAELDTLGLIDTRVISHGRYGRTRKIRMSFNPVIADRIKAVLSDNEIDGVN